MPNCSDCSRFIPSGNMCQDCYQRIVRNQKTADKIATKKQFNTVNKSELTKYRENLKKRLQDKISKLIKAYYKERGLYYCWIKGNTTNVKGLYSLHASHYYAKGDIWQLWCSPVNIGLSSYDQNVNNPQNVTSMRRKMIEVWGEEKVKELDKKADHFRMQIKLGIDKSKPTNEWMLGMMEILKGVKNIEELI
ncbi:MAG: hypothetical protein HOP11_08210 [Saprospiraceae bacterium]|nr:hypothetical protein [Saprospiraceae bacterium]